MKGTSHFNRCLLYAITIQVSFCVYYTDFSYADDGHVLATSKTHKLEVIADGGSDWCRSKLRFRMVLEKDSPDLGNQDAQIEIMNRLKQPITNDCNKATSVELTVIEQNRPSGFFFATAQGGWRFSRAETNQLEEKQVIENIAANKSSTDTVPHDDLPPPKEPRLLPIPNDTGYAGFILLMLKKNNKWFADDDIFDWWAQYRFKKDYSKFYNQEFKFQRVLEQARIDLDKTLTETDPNHITIYMNAELGRYNFQQQQFPLTIRGNSFSLDNRFYRKANTLPRRVVVTITDLDTVISLPMPSKDANAFAEKRTRWGAIDRRIVIALTVKIDPLGLAKPDELNRFAVNGALDQVIFYSDLERNQIVYSLTQEDFEEKREAARQAKEKLAKAEQERLALALQEKQKHQREEYIQLLENSTISVRMANYISNGEVNNNVRLESLRSGRTKALLKKTPIPVLMLFQADSDGRDHVNTGWPGHLEISVKDVHKPLKASSWYLASGLFSVPEEDSIPAAQLQVDRLYECTQPKCMEATNATYVIDQKYNKPEQTN